MYCMRCRNLYDALLLTVSAGHFGLCRQFWTLEKIWSMGWEWVQFYSPQRRVGDRIWAEKFVLNLWYLCQNLWFSPTLPDKPISLGAEDMLVPPPNWVTGLRMVSKICVQFVIFVLPSPRVHAPILHTLFWKQVREEEGGGGLQKC